MGAFDRLGRLVSIFPCGMVWYGMVWYVSTHKHKDNLGTLGSIVVRLEASWKRLSAFRAPRDRVGSLSRLGRIETLGMVWYGMYVCKHKQKDHVGTFASVWNVLKRLVNA